MPQVIFPPTPAASGDIKGRDNTSLSPIDPPFQLPPSAVTGNGSHTRSDRSQDNAPPLSPVSSTRGRKLSGPQLEKIALPPPPSRSRKIIQMKPKPQTKDSDQEDATYNPVRGRTANSTTKGSNSKKKGNSTAVAAGTAVGRKVARKTAHSIIERRRRSKMNEEFGVLKDLIPACRGVEMHKLAILQASIEYLRYLQTCVNDLKAGRSQSVDIPSAPSRGSEAVDNDDEMEQENDVVEDDIEDEEDEKMNIDETVRPQTSSSNQSSHQHRQRETAWSLASTARAALTPVSPLTYTYSAADHGPTTSTPSTALPSPYFGPVTSHGTLVHSQTTSPVFGPYYAASNVANDGLASRKYHVQSQHQTSQTFLPPMAPMMPTPISSITTTATFQRSTYPQTYNSYSRTSSTQTSPVIVPKHQGLNEAEASTALLMLNKDRRYSRSNDGARGSDSSANGSRGSSGSSDASVARANTMYEYRNVGQTESLKRGMSVSDLLRSQD